MKKSIAYLPAKKQEELRTIVQCVLEELPECAMIILYGSYARGTYVDYDQRVEYGVRTSFMSDYDLLVVTNNNVVDYVIAHILERAAKRFYRYKNIATTPTIQFVSESICNLNKAIDKGRYFYTDIKKDGIMLYDSGQHKLARRRKLNYAEIRDLAKEYFDEKYKMANSFLCDVFHASDREDYKQASFYLHQACENYYRCIILTYTLYSPKEHRLYKLKSSAKSCSLDTASALVQDTEEDKRLFQLLVDAYVQSRYNSHFLVSKEDIEALIPKVEQLRDITKQCCEARIAEYESHIRS